MKKAYLTSAWAVAAAALVWSATALAGGERSDSVVKMKAKLEKSAGDKAVVVLTIDIDRGWHLYANPVGSEDIAENETVVSVKNDPKAVIEYPKGKIVNDESLGKYGIYEGTIQIRATLDRKADAKGPIELNVRVNACTDKKCLKQATVKVAVP